MFALLRDTVKRSNRQNATDKTSLPSEICICVTGAPGGAALIEKWFARAFPVEDYNDPAWTEPRGRVVSDVLVVLNRDERLYPETYTPQHVAASKHNDFYMLIYSDRESFDKLGAAFDQMIIDRGEAWHGGVVLGDGVSEAQMFADKIGAKLWHANVDTGEGLTAADFESLVKDLIEQQRRHAATASGKGPIHRTG